MKTNKNPNTILLFAIIIALFFVMKHSSTPTFSVVSDNKQSGEGALDSTSYNCFDYYDNDADGLIDLEDPDCLGLGQSDINNNGVLDIIEYEEGTFN